MINYSIIIPHNNNPHLLQRCLDSIPQREDVQLIVVDDNSDTSLVDFTHFPGLERTDIECYFTKEGKGAGYARNVGLKNARGKWLLFADADDFFHEGMFSMLDKWKESDSDIIYFDTDSVISETMMPTKKRYVDIDISERAMRYERVGPCGKMIRHTMVQNHNISFDETFVANDIMFSTKIGYFASKIQVSSEVLYCATVRKNSLGNYNSLEKDFCGLLVRTNVNSFLVSHHIYTHTHFSLHYVLNIRNCYGKRYGFKALKIYLRNEPILIIIKDVMRAVKFKLKRFYTTHFLKNKND